MPQPCPLQLYATRHKFFTNNSTSMPPSTKKQKRKHHPWHQEVPEVWPQQAPKELCLILHQAINHQRTLTPKTNSHQECGSSLPLILNYLEVALQISFPGTKRNKHFTAYWKHNSRQVIRPTVQEVPQYENGFSGITNVGSSTTLTEITNPKSLHASWYLYQPADRGFVRHQHHKKSTISILVLCVWVHLPRLLLLLPLSLYLLHCILSVILLSSPSKSYQQRTGRHPYPKYSLKHSQWPRLYLLNDHKKLFFKQQWVGLISRWTEAPCRKSL